MRTHFPWQPARQTVCEHLFLRSGVLLNLHGVPGLRIRPGSAELWITRHGDTQDYFVAPGLDHELPDGGHYIVSSFEPTPVMLHGRLQPRPGWAIERVPLDGVRQRVAPRGFLDRRLESLVDALAAWGRLRTLFGRG